MKLDALIAKTRSSDTNGCIFTGYLEKGTYVLVPYSSKVSKNSYQFLHLEIYLEREESITFNKASIQEYYYSNTSANNDNVIQKL